MRNFLSLIDPEIGIPIIIWLGWLMVALGVLKIVVYLIGEISPGAWDKIKSPTIKKLLTGKGNRLLFGLGGLVTVIFGFGAIGIALLIRYLHSLT
ncbi:MAG: hypothetical protein P1V20_30515 [Verrucomicrobiales bacterium]|nr:hypothetical protein [Verrucomicrobiales bacterium]